MNRRGSFFLATLTVVAVFVFIVFISMNKEKILKENKIVDIGESSESVINITLEQENIELFLDKAMEYASFNALKELGNDGGTLKDQNCERMNGYIIWKGDCYFSDKLEENFFERFKVLFDGYVKEYGLNLIDAEWRIGENADFIIELNGMIELEQGGIGYGFELDNKYPLDYGLGIYNEVLGKANECIRDEELKGIGRNNLFEDCRNDKDLGWAIKTEDEYVLFGVSKRYKDLGIIVVRFALMDNQ